MDIRTKLTTPPGMIVTLAENWAAEMAADCQAARQSIHISALSLQPPRQNNGTAWSSLWQSWLNAALRGVTVEIYLPETTPIHPATKYNREAAKIAYDHGLRVRTVPQPRLLHAKSCIVDALSIWIGSGNMTAAAAHHNHEIYINFHSNETALKILSRWQAIANQ